MRALLRINLEEIRYRIFLLAFSPTIRGKRYNDERCISLSPIPLNRFAIAIYLNVWHLRVIRFITQQFKWKNLSLFESLKKMSLFFRINRTRLCFYDRNTWVLSESCIKIIDNKLRKITFKWFDKAFRLWKSKFFFSKKE